MEKNSFTQYSLSSFISFNSTQNMFKFSCCTNTKMIWSVWKEVKLEDTHKKKKQKKKRCWTLQAPKTSNIKFLPATLMQNHPKRLRELKKGPLVIFISIFKRTFPCYVCKKKVRRSARRTCTWILCWKLSTWVSNQFANKCNGTVWS